MTRTDEEPSYGELEDLFVNNKELDRIGGYLNRFNPIRIMRMEGMEIRHSAILAWLLDPLETHGFGDRFLKAFLAQALMGRSGIGSPTALDVSQSDLRDAEVRREWNNIDILILSPIKKWAFVVENKYHSRQRSGQISGYIKKVEDVFGDSIDEIWGILLTLNGEESEDNSSDDDAEKFKLASIGYTDICGFLPDLIDLEGQSMGQEAKVFLSHYLEVIRERTNMSEEREEMKDLARRLYRSHKKVLEFVMKHGAHSEFTAATESIFGKDLKRGADISCLGKEYKYEYHEGNSYRFSFLPKKWVENMKDISHPMEGCKDWWAEYPLICWLELFEGGNGIGGGLRLYAEVGPIADHRLRKSLINGIKGAAEKNAGLKKFIGFQHGADAERKKYSKFFKSNTRSVEDVHDVEKIQKAIEYLLNEFQGCFDAVAEVLPDFTREATGSQSTV